MSEKYETEIETEEYLEYLEYPENQEKKQDFEFLKELTSTHYVEKIGLNETELKKQERDEKRQMGRFIQDQQREEKRQIRMNKEKDMRQKKRIEKQK